jgi:DNA polymerase
LHNLPRAKVDNPEEYIEKFLTFRPVEDPVNVAKALIRPMVCAPPGYKLICSDYSSIENRLLAWVAEDENALEIFRTGGDQYVDMASFMYSKAPNDVTKAERQVGKIVILGCGYGMGAKRFVETAADWGVDLSHSEATAAVNAYRDRYSKVKKLWYRLKDCAVAAIQNPGRAYKYNRCRFKVVRDRNNLLWLVLNLPSGRNLFYNSPYLSEDDYGLAPGHYGINPYSKKWSRLKLIPGRITENVIQALARDIMAYGLRQVELYLPEVRLIGSVHDEAIGEIREDLLGEDT